MSALRPVLMIAYHFPPLAGSSGIQRTLRFVQQLPQFGWQPAVLTAHPRAYERTSDDLLRDVPKSTVVHRAFALDTARHLSIGGRYVSAMARPDRWISWRYDAVRQGLAMIAALKPRAIWSTYPIATAHVIGAELHRRSGLPWVADFRDPMAQDGYPADPRTHRRFTEIERHAMSRAAASVFTTPGAAATYRSRYPESAARVDVIENGYDEEAFAASETSWPHPSPLNPGKLTLLHSGIVYPSERDPAPFIEALGRLRRSGAVDADRLCVRFRAPVHVDLLQRLAGEHGVAEMIEVLPALPYREALREMRSADALVVMQAGNCNDQIPGKLYEYLRAGRPILGLADAAGDTAALLRSSGVDSLVPLDDAAAIASALPRYLQRVAEGKAPLPAPKFVEAASREGRTAALAKLLDGVVDLAGTPAVGMPTSPGTHGMTPRVHP